MDLLKDKIFTSLIAIATLFSVFFFWEDNFLLLLILIVLAIGMLAMKMSRQELITFFFCAFFGTLVETFSITSGAWSYTNPNFLNFPMWLPVLWGIAAIFMVRIYLYQKKKKINW